MQALKAMASAVCPIDLDLVMRPEQALEIARTLVRSGVPHEELLPVFEKACSRFPVVQYPDLLPENYVG